MQENELWLVIPGYSKYSISSLGRIKVNRTQKMVKLRIGKKGRLWVHITSDKKIKSDRNYNFHLTSVSVSSLMKLTFCPNPDPKQFTHLYHIDGNYTNNRVKNLKWGTCRDAIMNAVRLGIYKKHDHPNNRPLPEETIRMIYKMSADGLSQCEIAKRIGRENSSISKILSGYNYKGIIKKLGITKL